MSPESVNGGEERGLLSRSYDLPQTQRSRVEIGGMTYDLAQKVYEDTYGLVSEIRENRSI